MAFQENFMNQDELVNAIALEANVTPKNLIQSSKPF
jgi:hypothetical protein